MDKYLNIKTEKNHHLAVKSGMFWEWFPELSGDWQKDKILIQAEEPKKYDVIYADPPWDVKKIKRKSRPNQVEMDYPTMKLEEICKLPVSGMTKDNAVLFLWTTHAYLPKAFEVMSAWGFKYQRTVTWDKRNGMCLFGFHHRTEFLLFGYKGKIDMYPKRKAFPTMVEAKSEYHSQKPVKLMEYLIKTYTNEGEIVMDFTMGSGTTGVACKNTNRSFIGIEKDDKYFEIAQKRINETEFKPNGFEKTEEGGLFLF